MQVKRSEMRAAMGVLTTVRGEHVELRGVPGAIDLVSYTPANLGHDATVTVRVSAEEDGQTVDGVVDRDAIAAVMSTAAEDCVSLSRKGAKLAVVSGRSETKLYVRDGAIPPTIADATTAMVALRSGDLVDALRRCASFADGGQLWAGTRLERDEGSADLRLIATDGIGLVHAVVPGSGGSAAVTLPPRASLVLRTIAERVAPEVPVMLTLGTAWARLTVPGVGTASVRLVEAGFPEYKDLLHQRGDPTASASVSREELAAAIERVGAVCSGTHRVEVTMGSYDYGEGPVRGVAFVHDGDRRAVAGIDADVTGDAVVGFGFGNLRSVVRALPEGPVRVEFRGPASPAVFRSDATTVLLMPRV